MDTLQLLLGLLHVAARISTLKYGANCKWKCQLSSQSVVISQSFIFSSLRGCCCCKQFLPSLLHLHLRKFFQFMPLGFNTMFKTFLVDTITVTLIKIPLKRKFDIQMGVLLEAIGTKLWISQFIFRLFPFFLKWNNHWQNQIWNSFGKLCHSLAWKREIQRFA